MTRRDAGRISRRPQGAFVAGGARRRRLSWSRPKAHALESLGYEVKLIGGASRKHETARRAVHESLRARDAKASGPVVNDMGAPVGCFGPWG